MLEPISSLMAHFMRSELASMLYVDEVLDGSGRLQYIDTSGSVSALVEGEELSARDPQEKVRRILNAS